MQKVIVPLNELKHGVVLPVAIYDAQIANLLLLNRGITLTKEIISGLRRRGVNQIAIDSRYAASIRIGKEKSSRQRITKRSANTKSGSTRRQARDKTRSEESSYSNALSKGLKAPQTSLYQSETEKKFASTNEEHAAHLETYLSSLKDNSVSEIQCESLSKIAEESIELLLGDLDLFVKLIIESGQSKAQNEHCLRTAKLAMSIATTLEFSKDDVSQLGMGCMISRIGIGEEIQQLIDQPKSFTPLETLEMKKHASRKIGLLEKIPGVPLGAKQVAWQIHERWNGSGYPRGRTASQIPPTVRIASVADAFVAMISNRPTRRAMTPYAAVEAILEDTRNGLFEPNSVRGLFRTISLFPLGSHIKLSNKMLAVTVRNHSKNYDRPIIKVICDSSGIPIPPEVINLSEQEDLQIVSILDATEIEELHSIIKSHDDNTAIDIKQNKEVAIS